MEQIMNIKSIAVVFTLAFCMNSFGADYRIAIQDDFDRLRVKIYQPGDRILFKRGVHFSGMFAPAGEGHAQAPIRIEAYGQGERPQIHSMGKYQAGLFLHNSSFWEVSGLEITNTNGTEEDQGDLFGIYVLANGDEGIYEHVYIDDCYVHDVNGAVAGKRRGGIHVHIKDLERSKFHDLRITNNRIINVGGVGIGNESSCGKVEFRENSTAGHNLWTKVYVADNVVDHTGRNNMIARVSKDAVYERNVLANSSRYDTGHSIFCFNTDGIRIQFNEAYGNVGKGHDRGGFDADYNCVNTFIQYNYSHDNEWFCGIMRKMQRNVVIRYNVSQNDRKGIYFYGFKRAMQAEGIHIYNNTHYVGKGLDVDVLAENIPPLGSRFENNIFYFEGEGQWGRDREGTSTLFNNNVYFNVAPHPSDSHPHSDEPLFVDAGNTGTEIDLKTMKALRGYRLSSDSPYHEGAVPIKNNGGRNLLNEKLPSDRTPFGAL
jgi:hypothetical protein